MSNEVIKSISTKEINIDGGKTIKLLWGGSAYSSQHDFMHFELRQNAADNRNYQKWVHEIDIQTIKDYLNEFDKPGVDYNY